MTFKELKTGDLFLYEDWIRIKVGDTEYKNIVHISGKTADEARCWGGYKSYLPNEEVIKVKTTFSWEQQTITTKRLELL